MIQLLATVGSVVAGGAVATVTVIGLVTAQTGTDGQSPADATEPVVAYGTSGTQVPSE